MSDQRQEVSPEQWESLKIALGQDAQQFKRTKVGKYIFEVIEHQEAQLIEDLIAADPEDAKVQRDIRNEIYKRRTLPLFIDEAIRAGNAAQENLNAMDAASTDY